MVIPALQSTKITAYSLLEYTRLVGDAVREGYDSIPLKSGESASGYDGVYSVTLYKSEGITLDTKDKYVYIGTHEEVVLPPNKVKLSEEYYRKRVRQQKVVRSNRKIDLKGMRQEGKNSLWTRKEMQREMFKHGVFITNIGQKSKNAMVDEFIKKRAILARNDMLTFDGNADVDEYIKQQKGDAQ